MRVNLIHSLNNLFRSAITIFMISGVVLITRPPFLFGHQLVPDNSTNHTVPEPDIDGASPELLVTMGYVCAICVPLLSAIISILTRQCKHVPAYLLMFWFGTGALIVSSICKYHLYLVRPQDRTGQEQLFMYNSNN